MTNHLEETHPDRILEVWKETLGDVREAIGDARTVLDQWKANCAMAEKRLAMLLDVEKHYEEFINRWSAKDVIPNTEEEHGPFYIRDEMAPEEIDAAVLNFLNDKDYCLMSYIWRELSKNMPDLTEKDLWASVTRLLQNCELDYTIYQSMPYYRARRKPNE